MTDDPFSSYSGPHSGGFPDDPVFAMPAAPAQRSAPAAAVLNNDPFAAFSSAPAAAPVRPTSGDLLDGFGTAAPPRTSSGRAGTGGATSGAIDDDLLAGFIDSTGDPARTL